VTSHVLYELEGNASRESVRMALGQLLDYSRYIESTTFPGQPQLVVVLPARPADDLADLLAGQGIIVAYLENGSLAGLPL
jgi:excinuclease UvrABC helicase subunit UvrB